MYQYVKRVLDIVLCGLAMVVLSPIYLLTAIGIEVSSPGTVLYHSMRAGKDKKPFRFYKFRSMHQGKKKDMFVADPDRVFPFGKLIRRLKIDELPQLFNVLKGDMSIVGPRPMSVERVNSLYSGAYEKVSSVRPGLTSAASLFDYTVGDTYKDDAAYRREVLPVKLELEKLYVERQSFGYDASLVWRTITTILSVLLGKKNFKDQPELMEIKNKSTEITV
ncbi:MAG: sugar transferase [Clostridia bacterium]|nr:sugar transferase [Clostridia bacterium]